jgi:sugar phosphate isomerase/epimerase
MEISGYSDSFGGVVERVEVDHLKVIQFYRDMGIKTIELSDRCMSDDEIPAIIDALGEAEMSVSMYDIRCDVVSRDAAVRKARTEKFHERLRLPNKLGATKVLISPGYPSPDSDFSAEECQEWLHAAIAESLPVIKELGMTATIPNLGIHADIYGTSDYILASCKAFGSELKMTYDVGNFLMANEDPIEALNTVYPYVVHVHFKDWEIVANDEPGTWAGIDGRLFMGKALGEGIVDLPGTLARLKELNYDGRISVEYEGVGDPWNEIAHGIAYLRTLL